MLIFVTHAKPIRILKMLCSHHTKQTYRTVPMRVIRSRALGFVLLRSDGERSNVNVSLWLCSFHPRTLRRARLKLR